MSMACTDFRMSDNYMQCSFELCKLAYSGCSYKPTQLLISGPCANPAVILWW